MAYEGLDVRGGRAAEEKVTHKGHVEIRASWKPEKRESRGVQRIAAEESRRLRKRI